MSTKFRENAVQELGKTITSGLSNCHEPYEPSKLRYRFLLILFVIVLTLGNLSNENGDGNESVT